METLMTKQFKQAGSGIPLSCAEEAMDSARNSSDKGLSQWFTPRAFGKLVALPLPEYRSCIVDLNCGRGDLLFAAANASTFNVLGVDIDSRASAKQPGDNVSLSKCVADLTLLYPLMREVNWQADLFVLNPPWGLHWYKERLAELGESDLLTVRHAFQQEDRRLSKSLIDSTCATIMIALDRMTHRGECVVLANDSTMERLIFAADAPYRELSRHCWARFTVQGNPMTEDDNHAWSTEGDFKTGLLYFAKGHIDGPKIHEHASTPEELAEVLQQAKGSRWTKRQGPRIEGKFQVAHDCSITFGAIRDQWKVQVGEKKPEYNIWLNADGTIGTYLSVFEERSVKVDKERVKRLFKLKDEKPIQLVMQAAQRAELMWAVNGNIWKVHPDLPAKVQEAVLAYHAVRAPLTPLSAIQRLGYLDEEKFITCRKTLYLKDHAGEIAPAGLACADEFLKRPNRGTWDELYGHVLYNARTAWQLVCQLEPDFPKVSGKDSADLSVKWKRIPKVDTIRKLIYRTPVFSEGGIYSLRTKAVRVQRKKWKPSLTWGDEECLMNGMELAIWITDEAKNERLFMDRRHDAETVEVADDADKLTIDFYLQDIAEHFDIPAVPSVAECNPDRHKLYTHRLNELELALNDLVETRKVA